jgi:hypothetical protein
MMKTIKRTPAPSKIIGLLILLFLASTYGSAQVLNKGRTDLNKPETEVQADIYWHVKAYHHPLALLLKVKAIDKEGNIHDVKAIQDSYDTSMLNVKALVNGKQLPVKLLVKESDLYYPVKAIDDDGTLIDIKVITDDGQILDVKGVSTSGNIVNVRAISANSVFYNIIAVSPAGKVNTVKGVKMVDTQVETVIHGVSIFAHIKALKQD